ncbi:MAG: hypothetical protein IJV04_06435, partial [Lachnospiraceae bacterium]|nr:hypothetical protein [Lachnospiraceae bacterium]
AYFLGMNANDEVLGIFEGWSGNQSGRGKLQKRKEEESTRGLKNLLTNGNMTYANFGGRLRACKAQLESIPEKTDAIRDAISLCELALGAFREDSYKEMAKFLTGSSIDDQRRFLKGEYQPWSGLRHWDDRQVENLENQLENDENNINNDNNNINPEEGEVTEQEREFFNTKTLGYGRIIGEYIERKGSQEQKEFFRDFVGYEAPGSAQGKLNAAVRDKNKNTLNTLYRIEDGGADLVMLSGVKDILKQNHPFAALKDEHAENSDAMMELLLAMRMLGDLMKPNASATLKQFKYVALKLGNSANTCRDRGFFANKTDEEQPAVEHFKKLRKLSSLMVRLANEQNLLSLINGLRIAQLYKVFGNRNSQHAWFDARRQQGGAALNVLPANIRYNFSNIMAYFYGLNAQTDEEAEEYVSLSGNTKGRQLRIENRFRDTILANHSVRFSDLVGRLQDVGNLNQEEGAAVGSEALLRTVKDLVFGENNDQGDARNTDALAVFLRRLPDASIKQIFGRDTPAYAHWRLDHPLRKDAINEQDINEGPPMSLNQKEQMFFGMHNIDISKIIRYYLYQSQRARRGARDYYETLRIHRNG